MPQIFSTGSGSSTASRFSGVMTVNPSGFSRSLASLARYLFGATPTEAVSPVCVLICRFNSAAIASGGPIRRSVPVMSRNASSTLSGWTVGEKSSSTSNICRDFSRIRSPGTLTQTACGQRRRARLIGIAERQPYLRASYDAVVTTPRLPTPPVRIALPRRAGSSSSAMAAKKASMSTWKMVRGNSATAALSRGARSASA